MNTGTTLVSGANGFVGSHLCEKLINSGHKVRALVRKTSNLRFLEHIKPELVYGDISDPESLKAALDGVDTVIHPAGLVKARDLDAFMRVNRDGTHNLLDAALKYGKDIRRFVHISSQAAVGPSESLEPVQENITPQPVSNYGRSKLESENVVLEYKDRLPITIIRPPAVYGPRDTDVFQFFKMVGMGMNVHLGLDRKYVSLIHVTDLVDFIALAAEDDRAAGETFFASNPHLYEIDFVMALIADLMNKDTVDIAVPMPLARLIARLVKAVSDLMGKTAPFSPDKIRELAYNYWICSSEKAENSLPAYTGRETG